MTRPLVSYVCTVFNKAAFVLETLENLRSQTGMDSDPVEFVFADDGSTDGSIELLQSEAARDPRVLLLTNEVNRGPAIRINDAAAAARGRFLIPVDADDWLAPDATRSFLDIAGRERVSLVFCRSRRGVPGAKVGAGATVHVDDDPLAFTAERQIVHMGFLASRDLWRAAGGADQGIFIQDQSLPLRLAAKVDRLAHLDAVGYILREADAASLSRNVAQQHHDRFLAVSAMLERGGLSNRARRALHRQAVSAIWKLRRDSGNAFPHLSRPFAAYLANRIFGSELSPARIARHRAHLARIPDIRRPAMDR